MQNMVVKKIHRKVIWKDKLHKHVKKLLLLLADINK